MTDLDVCNPVAESVREWKKPAARLKNLDGRRIALFWNMKGGGDYALRYTAEKLSQQYAGVETTFITGEKGFAVRTATREQITDIGSRFDAVIGASAD